MPLFYVDIKLLKLIKILIACTLVNEGIANGTACFTWGPYNCHWKQNIRIKNCGKYYVYQLPPPPQCYLRYCSDRYGKILSYAST